MRALTLKMNFHLLKIKKVGKTWHVFQRGNNQRELISGYTSLDGTVVSSFLESLPGLHHSFTVAFGRQFCL